MCLYSCVQGAKPTSAKGKKPAPPSPSAARDANPVSAAVKAILVNIAGG